MLRIEPYIEAHHGWAESEEKGKQRRRKLERKKKGEMGETYSISLSSCFLKIVRFVKFCSLQKIPR